MTHSTQNGPQHDERKEWTALLALPVAVALAGAFIGLGLNGIGTSSSSDIASTKPATTASTVTTPATVATGARPAPVTAQDHIRGNRDAKVTIIEYSDLECPFCKQFHTTLKTVTSKYKPSEVAWVYRHFPLAFHDRAPKEAEATECAAEQGGDAKFWAYVDRLFEVSPTNNKLDPAELPRIAAHIGLNVANFEKCLASGKYKAKVDAQIAEGTTAGAKGTPYSVIVTKSTHTPLKGAVSADALDKAIQEALTKN